MENILDFKSFNEDTSATGGPGGAVASGGVVNSQPSSLPGVTVDPAFTYTGGQKGSGDPSYPYNTGGKYAKVNSPMGADHGPRTGQKNRKKRLDMKALNDIFAKRQDYTAGEGNIDRKPKVMSFDSFQKADLTHVQKVDQ